MWSKFGIKKEPQRVYNTLRLNGSNIVFFVRHGFVSLKKAKSADCIFFCTQKPIFEKARKLVKKREKRRKSCAFQGASFLYALRGGGDA